MPKVPLVMLPEGLMKFAWLKMLKNSARNRNETPSLIGVTLLMPRSVVSIPGPAKNLAGKELCSPRFSGPERGAAVEVLIPVLSGIHGLNGRDLYREIEPDVSQTRIVSLRKRDR